MGEDTRQIRHEIEDTRARMTETVEAIGYRVDVKTRTKDAIAERKDSTMSKARQVVDRVVGSVPDLPSGPHVTKPGFVPDGEQVREGARQVKEGARQAAGVAQANPIGLGIGAVAVGFLAGMAIPSTRIEDERLGELSDQVKEQARSVGQEAVEHGKQVIEETAQSAAFAVQESGQHHGEELAASVRESVTEVQPGV